MPKVKEPLRKLELEEHQPGATRAQVFTILKTVATSPKPCQKRVEPPVPTSK
jgi:hypothetical protein